MAGETITIEEFRRVQLRVGRILSSERVPKSRKLVRLQVDLGEEQPRQILAGIGPWYSDEQLTGRKVAVVANLEPAQLMGLSSQGMLLAGSNAQGEAVLLAVPDELPCGAIIS